MQDGIQINILILFLSILKCLLICILNAGFTGLVAGIYDLELDGIMLEDKVASAIGNTQIGKDLFKMGTFAPDWGELIGFSLLFYEAQRRKF